MIKKTFFKWILKKGKPLVIIFFYILLMFKYSCQHYPPTTLPHPSHPHLPHLIWFCPCVFYSCSWKLFSPLIKTKSFWMAKENSIKVKREPTVWENIFPMITWTMISSPYKEFTRVHSRKTNNPIKKCTKDQNRHFSKDIERTPETYEKMLIITSHQTDAN